MKWKKLGKVFCANNNTNVMKTHATIPIADYLKDDKFRIYFSPLSS